MFKIASTVIIIALVSFLTGCTTVHPQISCISFEACAKLCKKRKGVKSMQSNIFISFMGKYQVSSETCICNNSDAFEIAPTTQGQSI